MCIFNQCLNKNFRTKKISGLNPTNKKSQKNDWISDHILGFHISLSNFSNCDPTKNYWTLFLKMWPASCTKKSNPIFFSKKFGGSKFSDLLKKNWILDFLLVGLTPR